MLFVWALWPAILVAWVIREWRGARSERRDREDRERRMADLVYVSQVREAEAAEVELYRQEEDDREWLSEYGVAW